MTIVRLIDLQPDINLVHQHAMDLIAKGANEAPKRVARLVLDRAVYDGPDYRAYLYPAKPLSEKLVESVKILLIQRKDGQDIRDWSDIQAIKNHIFGAECEAVDVLSLPDRRPGLVQVMAVEDKNFVFPFGFLSQLEDAEAFRKQSAKIAMPGALPIDDSMALPDEVSGDISPFEPVNPTTSPSVKQIAKSIRPLNPGKTAIKVNDFAEQVILSHSSFENDLYLASRQWLKSDQSTAHISFIRKDGKPANYRPHFYQIAKWLCPSAEVILELYPNENRSIAGISDMTHLWCFNDDSQGIPESTELLFVEPLNAPVLANS